MWKFLRQIIVRSGTNGPLETKTRYCSCFLIKKKFPDTMDQISSHHFPEREISINGNGNHSNPPKKKRQCIQIHFRNPPFFDVKKQPCRSRAVKAENDSKGRVLFGHLDWRFRRRHATQTTFQLEWELKKRNVFFENWKCQRFIRFTFFRFLIFVFIFWDFHVFDDNSLNSLGLKLMEST